MTYRLLVTMLLSVSVFLYAEHNANSDTPDENQTEQVARLSIKASFITSMISDGDGGVFVGTEDYGVYHYDNAGNSKQFTTKDGLGDDNAYALAIDKLGRLWVGHLNTGVSVFNGKNWKNYDVVDGPIGERVFDIQTCPVDGDVWIATSAGITRYKLNADDWEHFTREDGLPEDQAASLAFKKDGTLIVGTQCHGIAVFNRSGGSYKHSKNITAPERFGVNNCSPVPLIPEGDGLPTNQINQIIVASDNKIWIATPTGLVRSDSSLKTLQYVRGKDYADKVRGLYGGAPKDWKACPNEVKEYLLPEDYITCITEDATGTIWLGTRRRGFMAIDPKTGRRGTGDRESMGMADNYVSTILPMSDGKPLIGLYIGGVIKPKDELRLNKKDITKQGKKDKSVAKKDFPKLPSTIKPPTIDELKSMQAKLEKLNKSLPKVYAAYYGEDWKTQGDWVGRTTNEWAVLCAMVSPFDRFFMHSRDYYDVNGFIGPNRETNDDLRRWVHWLKSDDSRVLYDPLNGYRRQAEWDDHGEVYTWTKDGPDLWYILEIKHKGVFRLGMYFFNKDGHTGANRVRDYLIEIYPSDQGWRKQYSDRPLFGKYAESQISKTPPLVKSRMQDFWGGVHKQFVVNGAGMYFVKIDRNYSFNTILSGIFIQQIYGSPTEDSQYGIPCLHHTNLFAPDLPASYEDNKERMQAILWKTLQDKISRAGNFDYRDKYSKRLLNSVRYDSESIDASEEIKVLAKALRWNLNIWDSQQWAGWRYKIELGRERFLEFNPQLREQLKNQDSEQTPDFMKKWAR